MLRYGLAVALVALVLAFPSIRRTIGEPVPFLLLFTAALVAARRAGRGPGLLVALLGAAAIAGVLPPSGSWNPELDRARALRAATFLIATGVGAWCVAALHDARNRMEEMLDRVPDGFLVLDRRGRLVFANRRATELAGMPHGRLVGHPFRDGFPSLAAEAPGSLRRTMHSRVPFEVEAIHTGTGRRLHVHLLPTPRGMTAVVRDVTAAHDDRQALAGSLVELARTHQELEQVARMAHQLAQPLGSIANYAELIRMRSTGVTATYARQVATLVSQLATLVRRPARSARGPGEPEPPA